MSLHLKKIWTHLLPLVVHRDRQLIVQQRSVAARPVAGGHLPAGVHRPAAFQEKAPVGRVPGHDVRRNLPPADAIGGKFEVSRKCGMGISGVKG